MIIREANVIPVVYFTAFIRIIGISVMSWQSVLFVHVTRSLVFQCSVL